MYNIINISCCKFGVEVSRKCNDSLFEVNFNGIPTDKKKKKKIEFKWNDI